MSIFLDSLYQNTERKTMLYNWYMEEINHNGEEYAIMHGVVTGHTRLMDSIFINTTKIKSYTINYADSELIVETQNTTYHCPLAYCLFAKQDLVKNQIPDYEKIKQEYLNKINEELPTIEDGNVLLVLSNHNEYYFNSLYYKPKGADEKVSYSSFAHIGMFQDSFLIRSHEINIDLRYFPHYMNIDFYQQCTDNLPFYIENIGDIVLYCNTFSGLIKLNPGERKKVSEENAEKEKIDLPDGDLYPAMFISDDENGD